MAALRADSTDVAIYAQVLTESPSEALPPGDACPWNGTAGRCRTGCVQAWPGTGVQGHSATG